MTQLPTVREMGMVHIGTIATIETKRHDIKIIVISSLEVTEIHVITWEIEWNDSSNDAERISDFLTRNTFRYL